MVQSQGDHSGQNQVEPEHTDQHQGQGTEAKAPTGPSKWNHELEVLQWDLSPHWSPQRVGGPSPYAAPGLWVPSRALLLRTPGSGLRGPSPARELGMRPAGFTARPGDAPGTEGVGDMGAWKRGQGEEKEVRRGGGEDQGRKEEYRAGPERRQPDVLESQSRGFGVWAPPLLQPFPSLPIALTACPPPPPSPITPPTGTHPSCSQRSLSFQHPSSITLLPQSGPGES